VKERPILSLRGNSQAGEAVKNVSTSSMIAALAASLDGAGGAGIYIKERTRTMYCSNPLSQKKFEKHTPIVPRFSPESRRSFPSSVYEKQPPAFLGDAGTMYFRRRQRSLHKNESEPMDYQSEKHRTVFTKAFKGVCIIDAPRLIAPEAVEDRRMLGVIPGKDSFRRLTPEIQRELDRLEAFIQKCEITMDYSEPLTKSEQKRYEKAIERRRFLEEMSENAASSEEAWANHGIEL
jgi:hypothetical protein